MRNAITKPLLYMGALLFWLTCNVSFAASTQPETVVDYFLLLPQQNYFEDSVAPRAKRKAWLYQDKKKFPGVIGWGRKSVIDIKNDYIFCPGDGAQGTLHVALFRYRDKVIISVRDEFEEGRLDFWIYRRGRWKSVTKQVMPVAYQANYDYLIPRYGTIIRVTDDREWKRSNSGKQIYNLVWVNGKFKVRR